MIVNGRKMETTFWDDFSIADKFGVDAIKDTYDRAFNEWKSNHIYLTELVLVLNWKLWYYYERGNDAIARAYDKLWRKTHSWAVNNLKGKKLTYYLNEVD